MAKFKFTAQVIMDCERIIEAPNEDEAYEIACGMNEDEWRTCYAVNSYIDEMEPQGIVTKKRKKVSSKAFQPTKDDK